MVSPVRWQNRQFDELVERADKELELDSCLKLYKQAEEVLGREVPVIPMYYSENLLLKKLWVKGLFLSPIDTFPGQLWLDNTFIDIFLKDGSTNG